MRIVFFKDREQIRAYALFVGRAYQLPAGATHFRIEEYGGRLHRKFSDSESKQPVETRDEAS